MRFAFAALLALVFPWLTAQNASAHGLGIEARLQDSTVHIQSTTTTIPPFQTASCAFSMQQTFSFWKVPPMPKAFFLSPHPRLANTGSRSMLTMVTSPKPLSPFHLHHPAMHPLKMRWSPMGSAGPTAQAPANGGWRSSGWSSLLLVPCCYNCSSRKENQKPHPIHLPERMSCIVPVVSVSP